MSDESNCIGGKEKKARVRRASQGAVLFSKDICDIIKACRENRVSSFQYDSLVVRFDNTQEVHRVSPLARKDRSSDVGFMDEDELDNLVIDEDRLEHLKITDPEAYEQFITSDDAE